MEVKRKEKMITMFLSSKRVAKEEFCETIMIHGQNATKTTIITDGSIINGTH